MLELGHAIEEIIIQDQASNELVEKAGYVLTDKLDATAMVKRISHRAMDELEGWCSKQKASLMIDYVMMTNAKTIVEIGVFGGKSLIPMAFAVRELDAGGIVYGIDPWSSEASIEGMDGVNREWWGNLNHDNIMVGLMNKIHKWDLNNQVTLIRSTSEDAAPIENIDILHIDGNHSDETSMLDVTKWVPMVRKGGVIIFDDVNWSNSGIAVQWLNEHCINFAEFHGENVWGVWIKP